MLNGVSKLVSYLMDDLCEARLGKNFSFCHHVQSNVMYEWILSPLTKFDSHHSLEWKFRMREPAPPHSPKCFHAVTTLRLPQTDINHTKEERLGSWVGVHRKCTQQVSKMASVNNTDKAY
jgi:hypothetical protein